MSLAIAIMAAGKGTRLKSKRPKVLHEIGGKPLLAHVVATAAKIVPADDIFVIVGHEAERVKAAAAMEGLLYAFDTISRQPNTLDCHRLILWSRSATDPGQMKQRLMELYFSEGADLTDPKVLIQAAIDCGMDGALVRRLLASDADIDRVEGDANSAKEAGIDGVPCFIFGGSVIVTGAQSPEYLASAIERTAGQNRRLRA